MPLILLVCLLCVACGSNSPTAPSPSQPTPTVPAQEPPVVSRETYSGLWVARYSVTGCQETGWFAEQRFCTDVVRIGFDGVVGAQLTQTRQTVEGRVASDNLPLSELQRVDVEADNRLRFGTQTHHEGFTIRWLWDVRLTNGVMSQAGPFTYVWTADGQSGEGRLTVSVGTLTKQ